MYNVFKFGLLLSLTLGIAQSERLCNQRGPFTRSRDEIVPQNLANLPKSTTYKACVPIDDSIGANNGAENSLWYFREDLLTNAGHIYWHVSHPQNLLNPEDPLTIDRRGEMFYYFHRNIIARYNTERISHGLLAVEPLDYKEGGIIRFGYDPHLLGTPTDYRYPQRFNNERFENITDSVELWEMLKADIDNRTLIGKDGTLYSLDNIEGIDRLGELIEASINSVNDERYSRIGVHSQGHRNIGLLHEDIGESVGDDLVCAPIFNPSTAMRDPVFYLWHKIIDDIFLRHKYLLAPNHPTEGEFPLIWPGVEVQSISVQSTAQPAQPNNLRTFFTNLTVETPLTKDIFFSNETYEYCIKRLDYDEFTYNVTIKKQPYVTSNKAFVRIFLAPRFNFSQSAFSLEEQITYFFALDSFVADLESDTTVVTRTSSASNLLTNWKLETWWENPPIDYFADCGCGWPSHLLLPKGRSGNGMVFDLFVMVTDATTDVPEQEPVPDPVCPMRPIFCGAKDQKYPDIRPMGYPFDTKPFSISTPEGTTRMVANLEEYVSLIPNSNTVQVVVRHDG